MEMQHQNLLYRPCDGNKKWAIAIAGSHLMSILSHGLQARKTKDEKELFLLELQTGIPVYFVVSLLVVATFGEQMPS